MYPKNKKPMNSQNLFLRKKPLNLEENNNYKLQNTTQKKKLLKDSFYITYILLLTTGTICFIEAVRTKDIKIRNILNLEVCISVVAAYFYSLFVEKNKNPLVNYRDINVTRYTDWVITTPIMLLVLVLALVYNTGEKLTLSSYGLILLLNFGMLYSGYAGEIRKISKFKGVVTGFIFFFALYAYIYLRYMHGKNNFDNTLIYVAFLAFWSVYGLLYMLGEDKEEEKNIGYNILDLLSKCFVGIFFWAYFTKVFVLQ
jgi:bacteriorhodopsin